MTPHQRRILPLLFTSFIGALGFSIVLPSLVYIVKRFEGGDFLYGALGATYSAFQLIGAPVLGKLSDQYGRKRILLLSKIGSTLAWALFLVALALPISKVTEFSNSLMGVVVITLPMLVLFIARAFEGLTGGDISVANAYIADVSTPEERKIDFGQMGVAAGLGFMLGPALAGFLGGTSLGLALPISTALVTSLLTLILIVWLLPESHPNKHLHVVESATVGECLGHAPKKSPAPQKAKLKDILSIPGIPLLLLIYFVFYLAFSLFVAAFPLFATSRYNWSVTQMGLFFSFLSIVLAITEGPVLKRLSKVTSTESLIIWGNLIIALSYIAMMIPTEVTAYTGAFLYAIGNGLMWPSFLARLSENAGEHLQGYVQGVGSSMGSLASIIGLFMGGILFTHMQNQVFIIPAVIVGIVFLLSFGLRRQPALAAATK
jgi:MFS transporter, DHA1 family, tetracycline resistance protein